MNITLKIRVKNSELFHKLEELFEIGTFNNKIKCYLNDLRNNNEAD